MNDSQKGTCKMYVLWSCIPSASKLRPAWEAAEQVAIEKSTIEHKEWTKWIWRVFRLDFDATVVENRSIEQARWMIRVSALIGLRAKNQVDKKIDRSVQWSDRSLILRKPHREAIPLIRPNLRGYNSTMAIRQIERFASKRTIFYKD